MKRRNVIARLRAHEREIRAHGARSLYLFGSVARDTARQRSDIDIFIDYDKASDFSLIDLLRLQYLLEDKLRRKVDILTRDSLHRTIRGRVITEAKRVF